MKWVEGELERRGEVGESGAETSVNHKVKVNSRRQDLRCVCTVQSRSISHT